MKIQEFPKSQSNKTDINKTDFSETDIIQSYQIQSGSLVSHDKRDVIEEMKIYRELIQERIEYKYHEQEDVDELVELMVEVMMMPDDSTIRIAGVDKPVALVKNRFMKLNYSHIEYVLFCLHRNTRKVGNIKAYLLTTLYNAPYLMRKNIFLSRRYRIVMIIPSMTKNTGSWMAGCILIRNLLSEMLCRRFLKMNCVLMWMPVRGLNVRDFWKQ